MKFRGPKAHPNRGEKPAARPASGRLGRGRDADYPAPPARTRAGAPDAHGSYLGYLAANRSFGHGCRTSTGGSLAPSRSRKRVHVHRHFWLRRRIWRNHRRSTESKNHRGARTPACATSAISGSRRSHGSFVGRWLGNPRQSCQYAGGKMGVAKTIRFPIHAFRVSASYLVGSQWKSPFVYK